MGTGPCRYSIDFGVIHLLVISTEHDFSSGSEQWEFVGEDLKQVRYRGRGTQRAGLCAGVSRLARM